MSAIGSIDWGFLEFFFGDHGKITAAVIVLLLTTISLLIATLKYLAARMATKERDDARKGGGSPKGLTPQVVCKGYF